LRDSFRLIERPQKRANVIAAGCGAEAGRNWHFGLVIGWRGR
jgi:hypothetical protein